MPKAQDIPVVPPPHSLIAKTGDKLAGGAILAELLKSTEVELQRKGLIPSNLSEEFHPLWFLAETARNTFLWRNGLSLIQHDEFEFWVDVPRLIEKRLAQLEHQSGEENPFINPLWSLASQDQSVREREMEYLLAFREALDKICTHLEALSLCASQVLQDSLQTESKVKVMLPLV